MRPLYTWGEALFANAVEVKMYPLLEMKLTRFANMRADIHEGPEHSVGIAAAPMGKRPFTLEQRERRRAYLKAWRAEHREHCIAYDKRQRQKRREQRRADNARWYETHREQVLARRKRYYEENRERINQERKKRRRLQRRKAK
jgi:hypothetical protein